MAATQRGKKRGQRKRKQQPQRMKPKCRKPQLKQKKLPLKGGRKVRPKLAVRQVRRGRGLKRPYDLYVSKMLQQLHQDKVPMSAKAKGAMISYMRKVYNKVSSAAECHRKNSGRCTIGLKELESALRRVMPKKVAKRLATSNHSNSP
ncbi:histone H2B type 3-B-like [Emydura macquarii macquarii]|uniref:histone H2B type 3-B-like n=1 Tax=Emydura macquarii macquarii TaxID=1129001 RepID=UPI00352A596B